MQGGVTMQFNLNTYCSLSYQTNKKRKNKEVLPDEKDMKPIESSFLFISFSEINIRKFIEFVSEQGTKTISSFLYPEELNTAVEREI
jgi:hypothetical protein